MPQDTFDCFVIALAISRLSSKENYDEMLYGNLRTYNETYIDDNLLREQVEAATYELLDTWKDADVKKLGTLLSTLFHSRQSFDENMKPKSSLKKIFAGAIFQAGHPSPSARVDASLQNIGVLAQQYITMFGF